MNYAGAIALLILANWCVAGGLTPPTGESRLASPLSGTTLRPSAYDRLVLDRLVKNQALKLYVLVSTNGHGYCQLEMLDPSTFLTTSYVRGNYTNASNGLIKGRFVNHAGRFRGQVHEDGYGATVRLAVKYGNRIYVRRVELRPVRYHTED